MKKLNRKLLTRYEGFTIIETLIVLAVASVIIFLVFYAVPGLQRNSRNNQYRNEATRILSGANEYVANHSGALPTSGNVAEILANANAQQITNLTVVNPGTTAAQSPSFNTAILEAGSVNCPGAAGLGGASITPVSGAGSKTMLLIYAVEKNDGTVSSQCQSS